MIDTTALQEAAKEACIEMGCFCDDEDVDSDVCVMCRLEQALQGEE